MLGEQGRYEESFDAFSKVVGPAAAHSNLGVILASHQHQAEADAEFKQALRLKPDLPQPRAFSRTSSSLRNRPKYRLPDVLSDARA